MGYVTSGFSLFSPALVGHTEWYIDFQVGCHKKKSTHARGRAGQGRAGQGRRPIQIELHDCFVTTIVNQPENHCSIPHNLSITIHDSDGSHHTIVGHD